MHHRGPCDRAVHRGSRAGLQSWLNFIATEIHKAYSPLFNPAANDDFKAWTRQGLSDRHTWLAQQLIGRQYLMGEQFNCADAYLFTTLGWLGYASLELASWPVLQDYHERIAARPRVIDAMRAEGLVE